MVGKVHAVEDRERCGGRSEGQGPPSASVRTISTFSCDIAYSESPTALNPSARSQ
jgi:hypothetical protein